MTTRNAHSVAMLLALTLSAVAGRARACGASGGGATAVSSCSIAEHEEAVRKKWRVGAGYSFTATTILFGDDLDLDQHRHVTLVNASFRPTRAWTLDLGVGSLVGGHIDAPDGTHEIGPGIVATIGASWRVLDPRGARPFILLTSQLSYVDARTALSDLPDPARYRAFDLRLGAAVGWPLWRLVTPYVLGRGFGGPVSWTVAGEDRTGTDANKFQVGAGLSVLVEKTVDLFVEGVPLGERGLSAGAGFAF